MSTPSPKSVSGPAADVPPGFELPADAQPPVRFAHAPAPGTVLPPHYKECYACGPDEQAGLHLVATVGEGVSITAEMAVTRAHQGAPGLAHGGLIATAFDEALGFLLWLLATPAVTARLAVDYRRPVPVGHRLFLAARCTGVAGRKVYGYATAHLDSPEGPLVAEAAGLFVMVDGDHFTRHAGPHDADAPLPGSLTAPDVHADASASRALSAASNRSADSSQPGADRPADPAVPRYNP